jgi:hypothetical protein
METAMNNRICPDRKVWFSMWFLGAVVTFGIAFFPMFYRLVESRNRHFEKETMLETQIGTYLKSKGRESLIKSRAVKGMNPEAWAASIIFVIPIFYILYRLSRDLLLHETDQDAFLEAAFSERIFMPQTIPIKTFAAITIITLGVGTVYWLYKVVNLYNAHFKAHLLVEKEIARLTET